MEIEYIKMWRIAEPGEVHYPFNEYQNQQLMLGSFRSVSRERIPSPSPRVCVCRPARRCQVCDILEHYRTTVLLSVLLKITPLGFIPFKRRMWATGSRAAPPPMPRAQSRRSCRPLTRSSHSAHPMHLRTRHCPRSCSASGSAQSSTTQETAGNAQSRHRGCT